jgi:hypothetical protein
MYTFYKVLGFWKSVGAVLLAAAGLILYGFGKGKKSEKIGQLKKEIKIERKKNELHKEDKKREQNINSMSRDDMLNELFDNERRGDSN